MRRLLSLTLAGVVVACGEQATPAAPSPSPGPAPIAAIEFFDPYNWEEDGGYRTGIKALSGRWIVDCSFETSDHYEAHSFCVLKNWADRRMAGRPVPAIRGLRIVISSSPDEVEIRSINSSDYNEIPASLKCGEMVVPPNPNGALPTIGPRSTMAISEHLRADQCVLVFNTPEGEHAYDINIPTEGFDGAIVFAGHWIVSHRTE